MAILKEKSSKIMRHIVLSLFIVCVLLSTSGCIVSRTQVKKPVLKNATRVNLGIMKELEEFKGKVKKDMRVTVGSFYDKTGQFKDSDRARYSKALTQGTQELLYHMLYKAFGPGVVVERENENMKRITQEYRLSHVYKPTANKKQVKQIGLIQRGGPKGGLFGADYMVTGAIVYYHVDRYSGGGGVNIDGIGVHYRKAIARVGVELRLVNMSTSQIVWSTLEESWVSGTQVGADIFRFITAWGDEFLVTAEAGLAQQLPADYAFEICTASAVINMIKENKKVFIIKKPASKKGKF
jgi:curli biogenesis system outer membrane secretion channel CsgG